MANIDLDQKFENENQLQAKAIYMISQLFPKLRDLFFHPKNETYIPMNEGESNDAYEKRCMISRSQFNAMGLLEGVPDIILRYKGIFYSIELKMPGKKPRPSQIAIHERWNMDCELTPVCVATTLREVYDYCKWIISNGFKIVKE